MTTFKYKALSLSGAEVEGVIDAQNREEAIIRLRANCSRILQLNEARDQTHLSFSIGKKKIKEKELALVCQQFSIILGAGIPIVHTVELVAEQTGDKQLRGILTGVAKDVAAGVSLAASFEGQNSSLPTTFIETVRAGEESGALERAFSRLADYFTKKNKLQAKIITSLSYPIFVVAVAIIVIIVIMVYAVPTFTRVFASMNIDLPFATKALIAMSDFMSKYILVILLAVVILIVGIRVYGHTETGRIKLAKLKLKIPVIGKIILMNSASQLANTLSTMMSSGLNVMRALNVTARAMTNAYHSQVVLDAIAGVESGRRIGECLAASGVFPHLLTEMTSVGEESGSLENTLEVIGRYYDAEVETTTTRAVGLLEPIIICVLAVFVVLVLLAVYLPMFSMYGSIGA